MAINFPSNRDEAGLGTGPLQEGDEWSYNSIDYTYILSPDSTPMWSAKVAAGTVDVNAGDGIRVTTGNTINVDTTVARLTLPVNLSGSNVSEYVTDTFNNHVRVYKADRANADHNGATLATQTWVQNNGGGDLQKTLNLGFQATHDASNTGTIKLSGSGTEVEILGGQGTIELTRSNGPWIDFKNNINKDYDVRIKQSGNNLELQAPSGQVTVVDDSGAFRITRSGDTPPGASTLNELDDVNVTNAQPGQVLEYNGTNWVAGAAGDPLHRVTRFNIQQEIIDSGVSATVSFNRAITWVYANFNTPSIYFPSGEYTINSVTLPYNTSKTQISIYGDGKGEGTTITVNGTINVGHPVNINGVKFKSQVNGPTLLFRRIPTDNTSSSIPLEDDMDSTITSCDFGNGGSDGFNSACDIDYRGRNLIVTNCKFITGGTSGNAIRLSYFCNANEPISQNEVGWKRIMITNNNFHNFDGGAIVLGSSQNTVSGIVPRLRGLVLANNSMETDGIFLRHSGGSNCRLEGAAITGNTLIVFKDRSAIDLQDVYASAITGNTFNGYAENGRLVNVNIDNAWATTVTGNVFNSGQGTGTGNGALSGGTWTGCVVSANTWFGASTGRINITNTPDCDIQTPVGTSFEP